MQLTIGARWEFGLLHMELAEWLMHRAAKLGLRVRCSARWSSMMHMYFTNRKSQASIMWLEKKKKRIWPFRMFGRAPPWDALLTRVIVNSDSSCFFAASDQELEKVADVEPGFTKILSGDYLRFQRAGDDGTVYVTIILGSKLIAENFQVKNDHNIIVTAEGSIRYAKYGEVWKDECGLNHCPENSSRCCKCPKNKLW